MSQSQEIVAFWEPAGSPRGAPGWAIALVHTNEAGSREASIWPLVSLARRAEALDPELPERLLRLAAAATVLTHTARIVRPEDVRILREASVVERQADESAAAWVEGMSSGEMDEIRSSHSAEPWRAAVRMSETDAEVSAVLRSIEALLHHR